MSAASSAEVAAASPAASEQHHVRESKFYYRPPQEFVDDLINAVGDYLGHGCDEFEKSLSQQIVKQPKRQGEIARAVDAMYTEMDARLRAATSAFETRVFDEVLRIPKNVVVGSELTNAGTSGLERDTNGEEEEDAALVAQLAALQQRVANAAATGRALRSELAALQTDEAVYVANEEFFVASKKEQAAQAALVSRAQETAKQLGQLRSLHAGVKQQFAEAFGEEESQVVRNEADIADAEASQANHEAMTTTTTTRSEAPADAAAADEDNTTMKNADDTTATDS